MKLLSYQVGKGGSYSQSTVPRDVSKAWGMLKEFLENHGQDLKISNCSIGSVYAKGENEFVDQLLHELPGKGRISDETSEQKLELDFADIDECVKKISAIKKFPDDEFLSMGMNPIQVEFMSEFSFKTEGTDTGIFEYPDWCNSKQSVIVWIGPKSKLFLFLLFPYEFGTTEHANHVSMLLEALPLKPSVKNFRLCEKAKTKNTYKFSKPDKEQTESIKSFI